MRVQSPRQVAGGGRSSGLPGGRLGPTSLWEGGQERERAREGERGQERESKGGRERAGERGQERAREGEGGRQWQLCILTLS